MSLLAAINHLLNFFAPALFVALALVLASHVCWRQRARACGWWRPFLVNCAVGALALAAALALLGRDGRMLGYAALVLACASSQWLMLRPWRG